MFAFRGPDRLGARSPRDDDDGFAIENCDEKEKRGRRRSSTENVNRGEWTITLILGFSSWMKKDSTPLKRAIHSPGVTGVVASDFNMS